MRIPYLSNMKAILAVAAYLCLVFVLGAVMAMTAKPEPLSSEDLGE